MKRIIIKLLLLSQGLFAFGQAGSGYTGPDLSTSIKNFVPAAPATASLLQQADLSYANPSGRLNATFNLVFLECSDISVPVTLNYDYSGFKPQIDAGSVGLGFNINTGNGVIIKLIGGSKENFISDGLNNDMPQYPSNANDVYTWFSNRPPCDRLAICRNQKDLQPEVYHITLLGRRAKMFRGAGGNIYTSPQMNWAITGTDATGYKIVTEDGTICIFDKIQSSSSSSWQNVPSVLNPYSAFYMTKIIHANLKDEIVFTYASNNYNVDPKIDDVSYTELTEPSDYYLGNSDPCSHPHKPPFRNSISVNRTSQSFNDFILTSAISKTMRLDYHGSYNRTDIAIGENKYKLDSISLYNNDNVLLKRIIFNYDYFNAGNAAIISRWLKLLNIEEKTSDNRKKTIASFDYYNQVLFPEKTTLGIDHWGYWRGSDGATSLIPEIALDNTRKLPGADRSPVLSNTLTAALKTITYPTKGSLAFNYELNEYDFTNQNLSLSYYNYFSSSKTATLNSGLITTETININFPQFVDLSGLLLQKTNNVPDPDEVTVELFLGTTLISSITLNPIHTTETKSIFLNTTGTYTIKVSTYINGFRGSGSISAADRTLITDPIQLKSTLGGLRIKDIQYIDKDGITKKMKIKYQNYNSPLSSGILIQQPTYTSTSFVPKTTFITPGTAGGPCSGIKKIGDWNYTTRTSTSVFPLSTSDGYHVFYKYVQVEDSGEGKQLNEYSYFADNGHHKVFPFSPPNSKEDLRGKLVNQKVWDKYGNLVFSKDNTYNFTNDGLTKNNLRWLIGLKGGVEKEDPYGYPLSGCLANTNLWSLSASPYYIYQFWPIIEQSKEISYSQSNQGIEKISNMEYDDVTLNLKKTSYTQSDGKVRSVTYKYPSDFSAPGNVYEKMVNRHMINQVIETSEYIDNVLIYTKRTNYFEPFANLIVPQSEETFKAGGILESRITYDSYDQASGQLLTLKQTGGSPVSLLWTSINTLRAKVMNALPNEVFYQDFETPSNSSNQSHTGEKSLLGDFTCTFTAPNSKTYVVDYWSFDGTNWNYIKKNYTTGMSLTEGNNIDNVRIYPQDAQMVSYTYKIGTGITSEEAPNGIVNKYEYDDFYRLLRIRDQYNNIVKAFEYNFKP